MTAEQQAAAIRLGPKLTSLHIARLGVLRNRGLSLEESVAELDRQLSAPAEHGAEPAPEAAEDPGSPILRGLLRRAKAAEDDPECPVHGSVVADESERCEICDCRWLLLHDEAESPAVTASRLARLIKASSPQPQTYNSDALGRATIPED